MAEATGLKESKSVLQSKTMWTGIILMVLAALFPSLSENIRTEIAVIVEAIIFMVLRLLTSSGVHLK